MLVSFCKKRVYGEEEKTDSLLENYFTISEICWRVTCTVLEIQAMNVNEALNWPFPLSLMTDQ